MDIKKLVKAVEEKTGEKIVGVYTHKCKASKWRKLLCWLGFHVFDEGTANGWFSDDECIYCNKFR